MRRSLALVLVAGAAMSCGGGAANAPRMRLSAKDIYKDSTPAIVRIESGDKVGTGFIVDGKGLVATNLHVVAGEADIKVRMRDGTLYQVLQIANIDVGHDLALLQIQPKQPLPAALKLGDSEGVVAGDQVYAIGNPLGMFDNSITAGLVSAVRPLCTEQDVATRAQLLAKINRPADEIRRELQLKPRRSGDEEELLHVLNCNQELTILQISAAISLGSSGGPLFNQFGEVIGVTTAIITGGEHGGERGGVPAQAINLAVPSKYLKPLIKMGKPMPTDQFAKLTREEPEEQRPHHDSDADTSVPPRNIPDHPLTLWDGCKPQDIEDTVKAIESAIEIGAPAYNKMTAQGFEECFRIYEGTGLRLEQGGACKGVRNAFGDGLLRAGAVSSFKDKAWAMRDAFDGLLRVAARWCMDNGKQCPETVQRLLSGP